MRNLFDFLSSDMAIDLGTVNTLIYSKENGIVQLVRVVNNNRISLGRWILVRLITTSTVPSRKDSRESSRAANLIMNMLLVLSKTQTQPTTEGRAYGTRTPSKLT